MKEEEKIRIIPADCPEHDIIIEFSGWIGIDAKRLAFLNMETMETINGEEWVKLSEDNRENYIIEDIVAAIRDSDDGEWDSIDIYDIEER